MNPATNQTRPAEPRGGRHIDADTIFSERFYGKERNGLEGDGLQGEPRDIYPGNKDED